MPSDDRDQQLERALARHLRDATPDLDCPDAEILAAFHERTLALDEKTGRIFLPTAEFGPAPADGSSRRRPILPGTFTVLVVGQ